MKSLTIKDIALNLGFCVSTISNALSDHPDIIHLTRASVNELAKK
jgi:DNA-binding LacI/PurR family transcriptional regulator